MVHSRELRSGKETSATAGASFLSRVVEGRPGFPLLAGALVAASFSAAWLLLQHPNFFSGYDFMRMHAFYKAYFRQIVLSGHLPLWNPHVGLGRPFMADIETATLYPPNLLVLVLGVYGGVAACVVLHQALAIYGGVRLGQTLGFSGGASWLVGAGSALGGAATARLGVGIVEGYFSLCWFPVLLWLAAALQDRWEGRTGAGFAAAVALAILAGQPPLLYVEFLGVLVFLSCRQGWPSGSAERRFALGNLLGLAAAGALGLGLAAAELLPFLELVGQGNRPLNATGFAIANGMPAASWLSLIVAPSSSFAPNWEYDVHCGLVPLLAAAGGLTLWRDRNVRALLGMGLAGALLAAGDRAPFLGWVTHVIPGAGALRIPSRYGILFAAALLGVGAASLSRRPPRAALTLAAALVIGAACLAWLRPHVVGAGEGSGAYYASHLGPLLAAGLLVGLWQGRARWPGREPLIGWLLAVFCAGNWLVAMRLQAPVYSQYGFRTHEADLAAAMAGSGLFSPSGVPPRVSFSPTDVPENAGMIQGFATYNSYVAPSLARTWGYLHVATGVPLSSSDFIRLPTAVVDRAASLDGANIVADLEHATHFLVLRAHPDPRAYLAFDTEVVPGWKAADARMAARHDFHSRALLEEGDAPAFSPLPGAHAGGAAIVRFEPERVVVRTVSDAPAILVLAEAWYPGWRATIGGRPAAVFPVNAWMRGVVVPAGESEVTFAFRSRLLGLGLGISAASAALVAALALGAWPGRPPA